MNINFESYKVFYYAANCSSFSQAGEQLFISQSAVSQSIKLLEEKLQTKLFFREKKGTRLTPAGEALFAHVEKAYHLLRSGERVLEEMAGKQQQELRIAASDTLCKYFLLPYLQRYHNLYPDVRLQIVNRPSPVCTELVRNGAADLGVVNLPRNFQDRNLEAEVVRSSRDVFIAGPGYEFLQNRQVSLGELASYPLLLLEKNSSTRSFFEDLLRREQITLTPEIELESMDLLIALTQIGLGISFVMEEAAREAVDRKEVFLLSIKEQPLERHIGLIRNRELGTTSPADSFRRLLLEPIVE